MSLKIYYVAGLPRSGSTLLMNILGQNSKHHVTPTNGLLGIIKIIKSSWMNIESFKAQNLETIEPRIRKLMKSAMYGFYQKELYEGKAIFDKNRMWIQNIDLLEAIFEEEVRIICTVRDVRAVTASFEKLYRESPLTRFEPQNDAGMIASQTIEGRANNLLSPGGTIGMAISGIRDAIHRGYGDRLIFVPYKELVRDPNRTLEILSSKLELSNFNYDFNNVEQITKESDLIYGWGSKLHKVKKVVKPPEEHPWTNILPEKLSNDIALEFEDINKLANGYL